MINKYIAMMLCCLSLSLFGCVNDEITTLKTQSSDLIQLKRPNIVFIMFEDMSSRVGAFGDPLAITPNFDQLASEGVKYTNVFTTAGVCAPTLCPNMTFERLNWHLVDTLLQARY